MILAAEANQIDVGVHRAENKTFLYFKDYREFAISENEKFYATSNFGKDNGKIKKNPIQCIDHSFLLHLLFWIFSF